MNYLEIIDIINSGLTDRINLDSISEIPDYIVINSKIALPIEAVTGAYSGLSNNTHEIDIFSKDGKSLGVLCLCREIGSIEIDTLTNNQYIAYLLEVEKEKYRYPFNFSRDYILIEKDRLNEYQEYYMNTSMLWGGFVHVSSALSIPKPFTFLPSNIIAIPGINFPTNHHKDSCLRSILEPYSFERFLKLYHLLELLFDWDVVRKIQDIGDDFLGIGQILHNYERDDFSRLKDTIKNRCNDIPAIAHVMSKLFDSAQYIVIAENIFFLYGKSSNPIKSLEIFRKMVLLASMSHDTLKSIKDLGCNNDDSYEKFIINCAAYWIYRIRSSIAHHKIGEYIMSKNDEEFVACFAEPLIKEILYQSMK